MCASVTLCPLHPAYFPRDPSCMRSTALRRMSSYFHQLLRELQAHCSVLLYSNRETLVKPDQTARKKNEACVNRPPAYAYGKLRLSNVLLEWDFLRLFPLLQRPYCESQFLRIFDNCCAWAQKAQKGDRGGLSLPRAKRFLALDLLLHVLEKSFCPVDVDLTSGAQLLSEAPGLQSFRTRTLGNAFLQLHLLLGQVQDACLHTWRVQRSNTSSQMCSGKSAR